MTKVILKQKQYESMLNDFIQKQLYKQRIDKAIKFVEENYPTATINEQDNKIILLEILRGEDNENN